MSLPVSPSSRTSISFSSSTKSSESEPSLSQEIQIGRAPLPPEVMDARQAIDKYVDGKSSIKDVLTILKAFVGRTSRSLFSTTYEFNQIANAKNYGPMLLEHALHRGGNKGLEIARLLVDGKYGNSSRIECKELKVQVTQGFLNNLCISLVEQNKTDTLFILLNPRNGILIPSEYQSPDGMSPGYLTFFNLFSKVDGEPSILEILIQKDLCPDFFQPFFSHNLEKTSDIETLSRCVLIAHEDKKVNFLTALRKFAGSEHTAVLKLILSKADTVIEHQESGQQKEADMRAMAQKEIESIIQAKDRQLDSAHQAAQGLKSQVIQVSQEIDDLNSKILDKQEADNQKALATSQNIIKAKNKLTVLKKDHAKLKDSVSKGLSSFGAYLTEMKNEANSVVSQADNQKALATRNEILNVQRRKLADLQKDRAKLKDSVSKELSSFEEKFTNMKDQVNSMVSQSQQKKPKVGGKSASNLTPSQKMQKSNNLYKKYEEISRSNVNHLGHQARINDLKIAESDHPDLVYKALALVYEFKMARKGWFFRNTNAAKAALYKLEEHLIQHGKAEYFHDFISLAKNESYFFKRELPGSLRKLLCNNASDIYAQIEDRDTQKSFKNQFKDYMKKKPSLPPASSASALPAPSASSRNVPPASSAASASALPASSTSSASVPPSVPVGVAPFQISSDIPLTIPNFPLVSVPPPPPVPVGVAPFIPITPPLAWGSIPPAPSIQNFPLASVPSAPAAPLVGSIPPAPPIIPSAPPLGSIPPAPPVPMVSNIPPPPPLLSGGSVASNPLGRSPAPVPVKRTSPSGGPPSKSDLESARLKLKGPKSPSEDSPLPADKEVDTHSALIAAIKNPKLRSQLQPAEARKLAQSSSSPEAKSKDMHAALRNVLAEKRGMLKHEENDNSLNEHDDWEQKHSVDLTKVSPSPAKQPTPSTPRGMLHSSSSTSPKLFTPPRAPKVSPPPAKPLTELEKKIQERKAKSDSNANSKI